MVEIPETPKRGRSTPMSSQISCGAERMPGVSDSYSFQGGNSPLRQPLWGEEMSGTPALHGGLSDKNGVSKISCNRGTQHWNTGSDLLADKYGSTNMSSLLSLWGEFKTQFPAGGAIRPSHQENGKPEMGAPADDTPEEGSEEEDSNTKLSHWWDRKAASVSSEEPLPQPTKDDDPAVLAMFHAVASSCLAVRSQQKDEPDFTLAQKLAILRDLYHTKPLVFLERFRTALREDHLACFRHLSGNYEADFYCAEVRKAGRSKTRHTRVRNKRYAALQELIRGGEYFSDEQMRSRDPLLYEQYIGRYLSDEELQELGGCKLEASCTLSGALLDSYQERVIQQRLQVQQEQEEACLEEEESEDSESDEDEAMAPSHDTDDWVPDRGEKAFLREEFTSRMYQRFLDGKDRDFDYSEVDENPEFDNLDIVSRDEEERYFDEEEPEDADFMEAE
ncbi:coiled-coil domain-containing protein 97 isoform X2 [Eublepharis macularius]|nr:coiled-coil domain-containing protein 97 isoform X2 [Eublepharis macularius]